MIASACRGSWYFWRYTLISGNDIDAGFVNDGAGTLAVKSSSILAKRENAGRTGYSWSVMMTAACDDGSQQKDPQDISCVSQMLIVYEIVSYGKAPYVQNSNALAYLQAAQHRPGCIHAQYSYSLEYSASVPVMSSPRWSLWRTPWTPLRNLVDRTRTRTDPMHYLRLYMTCLEVQEQQLASRPS